MNRVGVFTIMVLLAVPSTAAAQVTDEEAIVAAAARAMAGDVNLGSLLILQSADPGLSSSAKQVAAQAAARELGLQVEASTEGTTCSTVRRIGGKPPVQFCRIPSGRTIMSFDPPRIEGDTAQILVGVTRNAPAAMIGIHSQVWNLKLVRGADAWTVVGERS